MDWRRFSNPTRADVPRAPGPFIRQFVEVATPILAREYTSERCLNATRICIDVMQHFHVRAVPLSVKASAFNRAFVERVNLLGRLPTQSEFATWPADAWSVGIDTRQRTLGDGYPGHVVAIVQEWLVDASAIQFSRPAKGMDVPDIFVGGTTPRFLKGKDPLMFGESGTVLRYEARLEDKGYLVASGFQRSAWNVEVAKEISQEMAKRR